MIYAWWYGGSSYGIDDLETYLETFLSIAAATRAYESRRDLGYSFRQTFNYADGRSECYYTPTTEGSEMHVFFTDPRESTYGGPDRVISTGPRGGTRVERV